MFGIDAVELVFLIVLFVIMFGPERMPALARKAAQAFVSVRDMASRAQTQLRDELGPDYADLELKDLNPKSFVKKHMSAEIAAVEEARRELTEARTTVQDSLRLASSETKAATALARDSASSGVGATAVAAAPEPSQPELTHDADIDFDPGPVLPPYDIEAT